MKRTPEAPLEAWCLLDKDGLVAGWYETREDAQADAWGPRFRPTVKIVRYVRADSKP